MGYRFKSISAYEKYLEERAVAKKAGSIYSEDKKHSISKQKELMLWLEKKAEHMRNNPTEAERKFKLLLTEYNIPHIHQKPVTFRKSENKILILKGYIMDFYLIKENIIVEIDGGHHNEIAKQAYDKARDKRLLDLRPNNIIRLSNEEVMDENFSIFAILEGASQSSYIIHL